MMPLSKTMCSLYGLLLSTIVLAQTPLDKPSLNQVTQISPYFFGPNAFPIPDMSDGRVIDKIQVETSGDLFMGKRGDHTVDTSLKINVPLWTNRASLSLWMPVMEWWKNTDESLSASRISDDYKDEAAKGHMAGDVYVALEMQLFRQDKFPFDGVLRSVLKTASGDGYHLARYYDSPGYFFDATLSRSFQKSERMSFRIGVSSGFLCWQTDNGRQNDAVMYGLMGMCENEKISVSYVFGGYCGWENNIKERGRAAHDSPMSHKLRFAWNFSRWGIFVYGQKGIRDYPYDQIRLGVVYNYDILK